METVEDCISRKAVIDITAETGALETQSRVRDLPSVTPKQKTGHWKHVQNDNNPYIGKLYCSECNRIASFEYNFCPNCGAKMEVVDGNS